MAYKNNITNKDVNKEFMRMLKNYARTFTEYAEKYEVYAERIKKSCSIPYSIGITNKNLLVDKTNDLKRLADLNHSAAKFFLGAVLKLANGTLEDEVLKELRNYSIFLADQIKSEENELKHTLSTLLENVL